MSKHPQYALEKAVIEATNKMHALSVAYQKAYIMTDGHPSNDLCRRAMESKKDHTNAVNLAVVGREAIMQPVEYPYSGAEVLHYLETGVYVPEGDIPWKEPTETKESELEEVASFLLGIDTVDAHRMHAYVLSALEDLYKGNK